MAPREPWGSPEAPRLQVSEGPVWAPAVSGRVEGPRRAEGGSPPEAVVSCGVARQRILGIQGKTGRLWVRDPYSATPTALPGSQERTTVPSVSRSGHPLSRLPHSPPHPVSSISSEARAPLPVLACPCPRGMPAALEPAAETHFQGTPHTKVGQTGAGAGCHLLSTILPVLPGRLPAKTPGLEDPRPPGGPAALSPSVQPGASVPCALNALPLLAPWSPAQRLLGCTP